MEIELPPWKIFTKAISLIWEKRLFALYISFPIILLYLLTGVAMDLGMIEKPPFVLAEEQGARNPTFSQFLWGLPVALLFGFFLAVIAVFWHRSILLGEHAVGNVPLRFDRVVWRYIFYVIGVFLWAMILIVALMLISTVIGLAFSATGAGSAFDYLLVICFIPFFLYLAIVVFRLSLTLPAAAIGHADFGFRAAWDISRGHNWQFLAILFLMFGLGIIVGFALVGITLIFGEPALALYASLPKSLTLTLEAVLYAAQTLISIGVLSLSFAYLTYEGPRGGAVTRK
ncbi:MAG: DUF898 domain-containing protein [Hyphomicrobiaceae bacterium]|nr:DUF898 domain-containing protein [Hyphomicrobiaceae bacterium]